MKKKMNFQSFGLMELVKLILQIRLFFYQLFLCYFKFFLGGLLSPYTQYKARESI